MLLRVMVLAVPKAAPPSSSSTLSPAAAMLPVVGRVTRKVVLAASAAFSLPSARSVVVSSATLGAAEAVVST